jgi:hypothetical protein
MKTRHVSGIERLTEFKAGLSEDGRENEYHVVTDQSP